MQSKIYKTKNTLVVSTPISQAIHDVCIGERKQRRAFQLPWPCSNMRYGRGTGAFALIQIDLNRVTPTPGFDTQRAWQRIVSGIKDSELVLVSRYILQEQELRGVARALSYPSHATELLVH